MSTLLDKAHHQLLLYQDALQSAAFNCFLYQRLDVAVFAAYGWQSDLYDEEILEKLLTLNLERGK